MKNEVSRYLENISLLLLSALVVLLPVLFSTLTTDPFILPKQVALGVVALLTLLLYGARTISDRKVLFRRTPFDLPLTLFTVVAIISSLVAVNRYDSLIAVVPFFFATILYFVITNTVKDKKALSFLLFSLLVGGKVLAVATLLTAFQVPFLPAFAKNPAFSPLGSLLDQALYLAFLLPIAGYFALPLITGLLGGNKDVFASQKGVGHKEIGALVTMVLMGAALGASVYRLMTLPPTSGGLVLLPFQVGFQTAFAAISQDTGRLLQGFLFGSGFGTYMTDFARFKPAVFNLHPTLWSFTFLRSSSFVLELLATVGMAGTALFLFTAWKFVNDAVMRKNAAHNPVVLGLLFAVIAAFILPFTFVLQTLFVVLLGLYAASQALHRPHQYFDVELDVVALRKGIFVASTPDDPAHLTKQERRFSRLLPVFLFLLSLVVTAIIGFFATSYTLADAAFQRSLVAANTNGLQTYSEQTNALRLFPYRDSFHRVHAQTSLALANSLAASTPQGSSPSAETQQTVLTLIQQAINSGRNATAVAPLTAGNWNNLSSVYRSIIGFGENAENFALLAAQQGIALDPNNPQGYVNLGGIYYQLGRWDDAQRQFQLAVSLKNDFANAYYNLGHALEQKGELQLALQQYKTVQQLVKNDKENFPKISGEIERLEKRLGTPQPANPDIAPSATNPTQPPLGVNEPQTKLPERTPQVEIPGPTTTPIPTPTTGPQLSPTPIQ